MFSTIFLILFTWTNTADIAGRKEITSVTQSSGMEFEPFLLAINLKVNGQFYGDNNNSQWISQMTFSSLNLFGWQWFDIELISWIQYGEVETLNDR